MSEIFNVKDKLPNVECGSYLAYAPKSFPKNIRWVVVEYYEDAKGFYSEFSEFLWKMSHIGVNCLNIRSTTKYCNI